MCATGLPGQCVFDVQTSQYYRTTCVGPPEGMQPAYGGTIEYYVGAACETLAQTIVLPETDTCNTPISADW